MAIVLSNALPVQFWLTGEESFNEKDVCGITQVCFCQPFECDDEIKLQFVENLGNSYRLSILEDSSEIESINFIEPLFTDLLADYLNKAGAGTDWVTGEHPSIASIPAFGGSDRLYGRLSNALNGVDYIFDYDIDSIGSKTVTFELLDSSFSSLDSHTIASTDPNNTGEVILNAASGAIAYVSITITNQSITDPVTDIVVNQFDIQNEIDGVYRLTFTPSDYDICDTTLQLKIIDSSSPGEEMAHSDCISIRQTHTCTLPVYFHNNTDLAGLVFDQSASPADTFTFRIPAIFFHPINTAEQEDIELSDETIVRLYNKLEEKQLLEIGFMTHYMHRKLQIILMADSVVIDGKSWLRRDEYQMLEGNRHYPLKRSTVLLTDKNFIKENQL